MEIVTRPDMRSSEEAAAFLRKLRAIVRYLGTCDGNMDEGSMRADVNVSVRRPGGPLGTRCEIKNVNSMRFIAQAVEYEARRQVEILESGGTIRQETRLFDSRAGETRSMRSKEEAHDYRYFPDPDLMPLELDEAFIAEIAALSAGAPGREKGPFYRCLRHLRPMTRACWSPSASSPIIYEEMARGTDPKVAVNWLNNEILGRLNRDGFSISRLSGQCGRQQHHPRHDRGRNDLRKDREGRSRHRLERWRRSAQRRGGARIASGHRHRRHRTGDRRRHRGQSATKVDEVKAKPKLIGWFVGQVMKETGGKANPQVVNDLLKTRLGHPRCRVIRTFASR